MKLRHSLSIFGLVAMLGLGVGVGLASEKASAKKAEAYSDTKVTLYVNTKTIPGWTTNANIALAYQDANNKNEVLMWATSTIETGVYSFSIPSDIGKLQVIRLRQEGQDGYSSENGGLNWANLWNYSGWIGYNSNNNIVKIKYADDSSWSGAYDYFYVHEVNLLSEEKLVFTFDNYGDLKWFTAGATTSIYLWNDLMSTSKVLSTTRVSSTSNTVYATLDSNYKATGFKAIRVAAGKTFDGSDWGDSVVWNEACNVTFTSENESSRGVIYRTTNNSTVTDGFETLSKTYYAKAFSYYFLEATEGYCGAAISNSIQEQIAAALNVFNGNTFSNQTIETFAGADLDHKQSGWREDGKRNAPISEAISRYYDMIYATNHVGTYSEASFLNLGGNMPSQRIIVPMIENSDSYNGIIIFVASSAIVLLIIGGYFYFRKRKEDR